MGPESKVESRTSQDSFDSRLSTGDQAWTLLADSTGHPGWYNMALDQWLLDTSERTGEGFLRLYRWDPHCLSFGRNEPAARRYDRAAIERRGISTVRRPTGGRAVWHARELTYAVVAPVETFGDEPDRPLSRRAFNAIHEMLLEAVRSLGVPASMFEGSSAVTRLRAAESSNPLGAGACFASAAGGELMVDSRKILGSAQVRQGRSFLQHGSLLLEDDQQLVADLTVGEVLAGSEATLQEVTGRTVGFIEASAAIARAARTWPGSWRPSTGPGERELEPLFERFRDSHWTWRR